MRAEETLGDIPPVGEPAELMDRDKAREALAREYARQGVGALREALAQALTENERLTDELRQVKGALNPANPPSTDLAAVYGYEAGLEDGRREKAAEPLTLGEVAMATMEPIPPESFMVRHLRAECERLSVMLAFSLEREERLQNALAVFADEENWQIADRALDWWGWRPEGKPWALAQAALTPPAEKAPDG